MTNLKDILKNAEEITERNKAVQAVRNEEQKNKKEEKERKVIEMETEETYDENERAVQTIRSLGFSINRYEKGKFDPGDWYEAVNGTYYCQYGDWIFTVKDMNDVDIEEGILGLYEPKNIKTGEELNFYCDLWCNNTSESRMRKIIRVMEIGVEDFLEEEYGHYMKLPELLRKRGFEVEEKEFKFSINDNKGHFVIKKPIEASGHKANGTCFIRVYRGWSDDTELVVTNKSKWDINSHNGMRKDEKAYYTSYKGEEELDNLTMCIESFMKEMAGFYGYEEDGKFYNDKELNKLFSSVNKQLKQKYFEKYNTYNGQIKYKELYKDEEGYVERMVNVFEGVEVLEGFEIKFNGHNQWQVGDYAENYDFVFEYDKTKDAKNCVLTVHSFFDTWTESGQEVEKEKTVELRGTFKEVYEQLRTFLEELYKLHDMEFELPVLT